MNPFVSVTKVRDLREYDVLAVLSVHAVLCHAPCLGFSLFRPLGFPAPPTNTLTFFPYPFVSLARQANGKQISPSPTAKSSSKKIRITKKEKLTNISVAGLCSVMEKNKKNPHLVCQL